MNVNDRYFIPSVITINEFGVENTFLIYFAIVNLQI